MTNHIELALILTMKTSEILSKLSNFYGTEKYTKFSVLFSKTLLTDGVSWLAKNTGSYWLMDIIGSIESIISKEDFTVCKLVVNKDHTAVFTVDDGNKNLLYTQKLEYTDFPLPEIKMYANKQYLDVDGINYKRIVMLPSEY